MHVTDSFFSLYNVRDESNLLYQIDPEPQFLILILITPLIWLSIF